MTRQLKTRLTSIKQTEHSNMYINFSSMNTTLKCWWCQTKNVEDYFTDHARNSWYHLLFHFVLFFSLLYVCYRFKETIAESWRQSIAKSPETWRRLVEENPKGLRCQFCNELIPTLLYHLDQKVLGLYF